MPLNTTPNLWVGQWTQELALKSVLSTDSIQAGLFRVEESIKGDKAIVKLFDYNAPLAVGSLCSVPPSVNGTLSDLQFAVTRYALIERICKRDLANTSYSDSMRPSVYNTTISEEVLRGYVTQLANVKFSQLETVRWSGDTASANININSADGIVKQLKAAAGTVRPTFVNNAITNPNTVIAELNKTIAAIPMNARLNPNLKLVVSPAVYVAYEQAMAANQAYAMYALLGLNGLKNAQGELISAYRGKFVGTQIPMYVVSGLNGFNDQVAIVAIMNNGIDGNFVLATDAASDFSTIIVEDRSQIFTADQNIDILWEIQQGVKVAFPDQVVLYAA